VGNSARLPWEEVEGQESTAVGVILGLSDGTEQKRSVSVNASPILGDDGTVRGTLATFDDLTGLERKNVEMGNLLTRLRRSRQEIRRQNQELRDLATLDPLTSCLNRRALFAEFERLWAGLTPGGMSLVCVMVDIDHFKSVNDRHGHATGDAVLQGVSALLREASRAGDLVARYGGEEFCVLLPAVDLDGAVEVAERLRAAIEAGQPGGLRVTASLGVSASSLGPREPRELIDQADQALYHSKRTGRNRVSRFDGLPADFSTRKDPAQDSAKAHPPSAMNIPFPAVTALLSALAYRDIATAEHSIRVADLCVAAAEGMMTRSQCYVLEVAALLHDIGKLGVPDAVLRKPGPLTEEEWRIIRTHDQIGEEITTAAFLSEELTALASHHHTWYGGTPHDPSLPVGEEIPLGARILTIADAFDAMVSDRVYRKGRSSAEAFAELRRFGGVQFDPVLVEHFIGVVEARERRPYLAPQKLKKTTAFRMGQQIGSLAAALDAHDRQTLAVLVSNLETTARESGMPEIGERTVGLQKKVASGEDWVAVANETLDLMDLCRATYDACLPSRELSDTTKA
jgi:diguanylate cyclase (GGDEF)-like protein